MTMMPQYHNLATVRTKRNMMEIACSCTKCGGHDSDKKVGFGNCINYTKRSENGYQKFTTENKEKAGESGADNNHSAMSNVRSPLFEC